MKPDAQHSHQSSIIADITALAFTGKGIARIKHKVCFIDHVFPGDRARIAMTRDKGNYCEGRLIELISPSAERTAPSCEHAAACGGCCFMGLQYERQIAYKAQFIRDSLQRIGGFKGRTDQISITAADQTLGYRCRIGLKGEVPGDGAAARIGTYAAGSHDLVPIAACPVADPMISRYVAGLPRERLGSLPALRFTLQIALARHSADDRQGLTVAILDASRRRDELITILGDHPDVLWCGYGGDRGIEPLKAATAPGARQLFAVPGMFQQVNEAQNQRLKVRMRALADACQARRILDLCCGNANLSLDLAGEGREIIGVESNAAAVSCARQAAAFHRLSSVQYLSLDAGPFLARCLKERHFFDLCILDPPRAGLHHETRQILELAPRHILYVSCNPSTLARDLALFGSRYEIASLEGFDFFPHTYHVETLAHLTLR